MNELYLSHFPLHKEFSQLIGASKAIYQPPTQLASSNPSCHDIPPPRESSNHVLRTQLSIHNTNHILRDNKNIRSLKRSLNKTHLVSVDCNYTQTSWRQDKNNTKHARRYTPPDPTQTSPKSGSRSDPHCIDAPYVQTAYPSRAILHNGLVN